MDESDNIMGPVSPSPTFGGRKDQNNNKSAVMGDDSGLTTTKSTQVSRETTSMKPTTSNQSNDGNSQLTTSSSSERVPTSDSGVNVNVNVNVNVGSGEARPRSDDGLYQDCSSLNMPSRFSSFRSSSSNCSMCHPNRKPHQNVIIETKIIVIIIVIIIIQWSRSFKHGRLLLGLLCLH